MWKKLFGKQTPTPAPAAATADVPEVLTLKARVAEFWRWYSSVAQRFYDEIESKQCGSLAPEVSAAVDRLLPGMAWVFGPGAVGVGHSFTLSPEGNPYKRFVAQYWLRKAPALSGWTFYAARQPSAALSGNEISIGDLKFGAAEIWVTPWVDEQEEKVDLTVWHPLFDKIPDKQRWMVCFLWLDEALGEDGVSNWIGELKLGDGRLADAIPLAELPEFVGELQRERGWTKPAPHEAISGYQTKEPQRGALRKDIIAGTTRFFHIVQDYPLDENPLKEFGANFVMAVIPTSMLPGEQPVDARAKIEDAISAAFESTEAGFLLGGAIGLDNAYIDLLLYDGEKSRTILRRVLAEEGIGPNARIVSFVNK